MFARIDAAATVAAGNVQPQQQSDAARSHIASIADAIVQTVFSSQDHSLQPDALSDAGAGELARECMQALMVPPNATFPVSFVAPGSIHAAFTVVLNPKNESLPLRTRVLQLLVTLDGLVPQCFSSDSACTQRFQRIAAIATLFACRERDKFAFFSVLFPLHVFILELFSRRTHWLAAHVVLELVLQLSRHRTSLSTVSASPDDIGDDQGWDMQQLIDMAAFVLPSALAGEPLSVVHFPYLATMLTLLPGLTNQLSTQSVSSSEELARHPSALCVEWLGVLSDCVYCIGEWEQVCAYIFESAQAAVVALLRQVWLSPALPNSSINAPSSIIWIAETLKVLFGVLATSAPDADVPGFVACESILRTISRNKQAASIVPQLVEQFIASRSFESDHAVKTVLMHLCMWPQHAVIVRSRQIEGSTVFLLSLLAGLVRIKKFSVLGFISERATPFLVRQMHCACAGQCRHSCRARRQGAWLVLKCLLSGHQHSPSMLHDLLDWLPIITDPWRARLSASALEKHHSLSRRALLTFEDVTNLVASYRMSKDAHIQHALVQLNDFADCRPAEVDVVVRDSICFLSFLASESHAGYPSLYSSLFDFVSRHELDSSTNSVPGKVSLVDKFLPYSQSELEQARIETRNADWGSSLMSFSGLKNKARVPFRGLTNLGNTCYANSLIQALYFTIPFRSAVLHSVTEPSKHAVLPALQRVFGALRFGNKPFFAPTALVTEPALRPSWFTVGGQQDASEYGNFLFALLDEELKLDKDNIVRLNFGGRVVRTMRCHTCENTTETVEETFDLGVSVPVQTAPVDVQTLLARHFDDEELKGDNQYQCDLCSALRNATRSGRIDAAPPVLIISLGRFGFNFATGTRNKIQTPIVLDSIISLVETSGTVHYQLCSVVFHAGSSPNAGHYYTFVAANEDYDGGTGSDWFQLNDRSVSPSTLDSVQRLSTQTRKMSSDTPYLLFYRRLDQLGSWCEPLALAQLPSWLISEIRAFNERALQDDEKAADALFRAQKQQQYQNGAHTAASIRRNDRFDRGDGGGGAGGGFGGAHFVC